MSAKIKSIIATVTGFLAHHIVDLNNVSDVLGELVGALPIDSQDKDRIAEAIASLRNSANNINDFLNGTNVTGADVTIKESDIVNSLGNYFKSDEGKSLLASILAGNAADQNEFKADAEGNGNA
jgi:hypothetical protein